MRASVLIVFVAMLWSALALAQDDATKARAQELYKQGTSSYAAGDFTAALAAFEEAFATAPAAGLHYNIAQCHRKLGNHERAIASLERFRKEQKSIPPGIKKDVKAQLAEQKQLLAAKQKADKDAARVAAKEAKDAEKAEKARQAEEAKAAKDAEKVKATDAKLAAAAPVPSPFVPAPIVVPAPLPIPSGTAPAPAPKAVDWGRTDDNGSAGASSSPASTPTSASARDTNGASASDASTEANREKVAMSEDAPLWTNPLFIGAVAGGAVLVAAGAGTWIVVNNLPGPTPPDTSLGTTDLR